MFHNFKQGIRNFRDWAAIIWNDRDWDFEYLEIILIKKLKRMKAHHESEDAVALGALDTAAEIGEVIDLLEKVRDFDYEEEIDPYFHNWLVPLTKYHIDEMLKNWGQQTPDEQESAKRKTTYEQAEENKQADLDKAYGLIAKNIRKWWD